MEKCALCNGNLKRKLVDYKIYGKREHADPDWVGEPEEDEDLE